MFGFITVWKDKLEKNRFKILYVTAMCALFGALAGWALLPDEVRMTAEEFGGELVPKNMALLANLGVCGIFWLCFLIKPREIIYFVGLCLGLLLTLNPLLTLIVV